INKMILKENQNFFETTTDEVYKTHVSNINYDTELIEFEKIVEQEIGNDTEILSYGFENVESLTPITQKPGKTTPLNKLDEEKHRDTIKEYLDRRAEQENQSPSEELFLNDLVEILDED
ncbi:MAG: hypothetical protein MHPSP_001483, partial [Paramarteilia canceri]